MPKSTELQNYKVDVGIGEVVSPPGDANGHPEVIPVWRIDLISPQGDRIWFVMTEDVKDELVRKLTGGIVLAGGKLPKIP